MRKLSLYELENHVIKNKHGIQESATLTIVIRGLDTFHEQIKFIEAHPELFSVTQDDLDYLYSRRGYLNTDETQRYT